MQCKEQSQIILLTIHSFRSFIQNPFPTLLWFTNSLALFWLNNEIHKIHCEYEIHALKIWKFTLKLKFISHMKSMLSKSTTEIPKSKFKLHAKSISNIQNSYKSNVNDINFKVDVSVSVVDFNIQYEIRMGNFRCKFQYYSLWISCIQWIISQTNFAPSIS